MKRLAALVALGVLLAALTGSAGLAGVPARWSGFYGAVRLDGASVPAGTAVSAWLDGLKFAEVTTSLAGGDSVYYLLLPADDPETPQVEGGRPERPVFFRIAEHETAQLAPWRSGTLLRLDLTAASASATLTSTSLAG